MKKSMTLIVLALGLFATVIWGWNYSALQDPLMRVLDGDARNSGIQVRAHFGSYVQSNVLVFDLRAVESDKAPVDIFRILLQFAEAMKTRQFERIVLAYKGVPRFHLDGAYFRQLGEEYSTQNPVFTMRTFPGHLVRPNGAKAFEERSGGLLGVLKEQMNDFNEFHRQWYIENLGKSDSN